MYVGPGLVEYKGVFARRVWWWQLSVVPAGMQSAAVLVYVAPVQRYSKQAETSEVGGERKKRLRASRQKSTYVWSSRK